MNRLPMLIALLALIGAPPAARAQDGHHFECARHGGIEKLRCERHERMFAKCGPLKGDAHLACDREFLLANPLVCEGLAGDDAKRCEAERAAFKTCEARPAGEFVRCVRSTAGASPMGPH